MPSVDPAACDAPCCVTIDVEEYYHIEAAHGIVLREQWWDWPSRVEANVDRLLALLDRHNRRATFFVLGNVVRRTPGLARRIADAGHEIASHGTNHDRLHRLNADTFREDLLTSKQLLEDESGTAVLGYRAPTFSVVPQTAWAIDVLLDSGFQYDASIFPVHHPWYGVPSAPDRPFWVSGRAGDQKLLEIPALTWRPGGVLGAMLRHRKLAVAGGGYFRLLPLGLMKRGLKQAAAEGRPAVLYFHPWEFDPDMPRLPLPPTGRLRTYTGLRSAEAKLDRIVARPGQWGAIADHLDAFRTMADTLQPFDLGE